MNEQEVYTILQKVQNGDLELTAAVQKLREPWVEDINFAKVDVQREARTGFPEVIYCEGKTLEQVTGITHSLFDHGQNVLATRVSKTMSESLQQHFTQMEYYPEAKIAYLSHHPVQETYCSILVMTGGTCDIPVAEEAAITVEKFGNAVERLYDVGVAGLHRLFHYQDRLKEANVVIVVAGMEGALVSVVGGLTDKPVIAVPSSIGYGANFQGLAALLAMLNSCSGGIGVVNIDNGFGAGYLAATITRQIMKRNLSIHNTGTIDR